MTGPMILDSADLSIEAMNRRASADGWQWYDDAAPWGMALACEAWVRHGDRMVLVMGDTRNDE